MTVLQTITTDGRQEFFSSRLRQEIKDWKKPWSPKNLLAFRLMLWRGLCNPAEQRLGQAAVLLWRLHTAVFGRQALLKDSSWWQDHVDVGYYGAVTRSGSFLVLFHHHMKRVLLSVLPSVFLSLSLVSSFSDDKLTDLRCSQLPFTRAELHVLPTACVSLSSMAAFAPCLQVHGFPWHGKVVPADGSSPASPPLWVLAFASLSFFFGPLFITADLHVAAPQEPRNMHGWKTTPLY